VACFSVFSHNMFLTTEYISNHSKLTDFRTDILIPNIQDRNRGYYVLANPSAQRSAAGEGCVYTKVIIVMLNQHIQ
jgi:hypothetical protein